MSTTMETAMQQSQYVPPRFAKWLSPSSPGNSAVCGPDGVTQAPAYRSTSSTGKNSALITWPTFTHRFVLSNAVVSHIWRKTSEIWGTVGSRSIRGERSTGTHHYLSLSFQQAPPGGCHKPNPGILDDPPECSAEIGST